MFDSYRAHARIMRRLCTVLLDDYPHGSDLESIWGFPKSRCTILGGPHNKDYGISGSMLGSHFFGKLPNGGCSKGPCKRRAMGNTVPQWAVLTKREEIRLPRP